MMAIQQPEGKFFRVMKSDAHKETFVRLDGFADCLECWKLFMQKDDRDLSASRMKLMSARDEDAQGYERDVYAEQLQADYKIGEAVNTEINDLKAVHAWAIKKKCSITTLWNFPTVNFMRALTDAEAELEKKLRKNIVTATKF
jgi:hypothetical protein